MYVHQYTKGEPNQFTNSAVIGTDVHTCSPPQIFQFTTSFYTFYA